MIDNNCKLLIMRRANGIFLLIILLLLTSCGSFKKELVQTGSKNQAIQNAILDFSNTSRLYKQDSVFSVSFHEPLYRMVLKEKGSENVEWDFGKKHKRINGVSIGAYYNKMLLDTTMLGRKGAKMPTRYIEKNNKLFYWDDDDYPLTEEMIMVLKKYNLLLNNDFDGLMKFYDFGTNDAQKGVHYYFCKDDLTIYRKVVTNKAIEYYDAPRLKCKK